MVERLLLDRIDAEAGRAAVAGELHAVAVLSRAPDEAQTALARAHMTETRAETAFDPSILKLCPETDVNAVVVHSVDGRFRESAPGFFPLALIAYYLLISGGRPAIAMRLSGAGATALLQLRQRQGADMQSYAHEVHPAQVAGLFYPAEAAGLRTLIAGRPQARPAGRRGRAQGRRRAARRHCLFRRGRRDRLRPLGQASRPAPPIVIVGPAHRVAFRGLAIHPAMVWSTPLGEARVARDLHLRLAEARAAGVDARPFAGEHSLEMHLVMLQAMAPAPFEIMPILVGDAEPRRVAQALRLVWGGPETVIAISSDLSHFLDRGSAEAIDADTGRRIEMLQAPSLDGGRACGFLPIAGALHIAAERDMRASGLHLATSADVGADPSRVVGYGAFAVEYAASARLAEADRALLLSTAMAALAAASRPAGRTPSLALEGRLSPALTAVRATLRHSDGPRNVTRLHRFARAAPAPARGRDDERGSVRLLRPALPAADRDRARGPRLDVSILSHPRPVPAASEAELAALLEPDRDGLILGAGRRRSLFLPSVWRQVPDGRQFVRHLLTKAGLSGWPDGIEATRFRVESFGARWRRVAPGEIAPVRIDDAPALH